MKALARIFAFLTLTLLVYTHGGEDSEEEKLSNQKRDNNDVSFDNNEKNLLKMMDSKLYFCFS